MTLLKVSGICKQGDADFILQDINFTQKKLQKIAIVGETGSGKSTLLKIIAGLVQPDDGEVLLEDKRVEGPLERLVPGNPDIAYLSQYFELPRFLTVEQILEYANLLTDKKSNALYQLCQIDHLVQRKTDQLSGGEHQRIAMARLLITSPKVLLLDEPFSHLDIVHKNTLKSVIHNISKRLKITCILVSHDPADTLAWADKILVMKDGQILQEGTPEQVYHEPVNEYTAGLFGKYNLITTRLTKAFPKLAKAKKNGKTIFLRPEDFKISKKGKQGLRGKVIRVSFFGNYYEAEVSVSKEIITVQTIDQNIRVGDKICLSLKPNLKL